MLLDGVEEASARPTNAPFPGTAVGAKRFAGQGPAISKLPAQPQLLGLCAFLAPELPRGLPRVLPEEFAQAVSDPLAYNRMLAVVGCYSLATVSPTTVELH